MINRWAVALTKVAIAVTKKIPVHAVRDPSEDGPGAIAGGGGAAAGVVAAGGGGGGGGDQKAGAAAKASEAKVINVPHAEVKLASNDMLPAGWRMGKDKTGRIFFVNDVARKTTWDDPRPLPQHWLLQRDNQGRVYFANSNTKLTQWADPRPQLIWPGNTPPVAPSPLAMAMAVPAGGANPNANAADANANPMLVGGGGAAAAAAGGGGGAIQSPFAVEGVGGNPNAAGAAAAPNPNPHANLDVKQLDKQQVEGLAGSGHLAVPAAAQFVEPEEGCGPEGKAPPIDGLNDRSRRPTKLFDLEWYRDILTICVAAKSITREEHHLLCHVRTKYAISESEHLKV